MKYTQENTVLTIPGEHVNVLAVVEMIVNHNISVSDDKLEICLCDCHMRND